MKKLKNWKSFNEDSKYMSDADIEEGYSKFELEEFKYESRDMSFMYPKGTFEASIVWNFPSARPINYVNIKREDDLPIGGFSQSVEDVIYTTIPDEDGEYKFKYVLNNWYPESVYNKMLDIIKEKLTEKYGFEYVKTSSID